MATISEPVAFITVRAHWKDIGGAVFGSMMTSISTEIFQEGIQFPALKFGNAGRDDGQILRLIAKTFVFRRLRLAICMPQLAACRWRTAPEANDVALRLGDDQGDHR